MGGGTEAERDRLAAPVAAAPKDLLLRPARADIVGP